MNVAEISAVPTRFPEIFYLSCIKRPFAAKNEIEQTINI